MGFNPPPLPSSPAALENNKKHPTAFFFSPAGVGWLFLLGGAVEGIPRQSLQDRGLPAVPRRQSLQSFLEVWLRESVKPNVRPWTYHGYDAVVRNHLVPDLGRSDLQEISPQQVQALLNRKIEEGLSPKSVQNIRGVLRSALSEAMRWELVMRNVASLVRVPRAERKSISPLSPEESRRLVEAASTDRLGALYTLCLSLGLRQGEALGLTWDRVDFDAAVIKIDRQLQRTQGRLQLEPLKTIQSRRSLPIPGPIGDRLRVHKATQDQERLAAGSRWQETGLVFTTPIGTGLEGTNVTKRFQALLRHAAIPHRRFHDLRHSCASLLLAQNVAPRVVMEILGHSQISLTMNTYTHVSSDLKRDAASSLDTILWRPQRR